MASYRIIVRPWVDNFEENVYDVEECLEMILPDGRMADYWSFVETFHSFERADEYAQALVCRRGVVKEYN